MQPCTRPVRLARPQALLQVVLSSVPHTWWCYLGRLGVVRRSDELQRKADLGRAPKRGEKREGCLIGSIFPTAQLGVKITWIFFSGQLALLWFRLENRSSNWSDLGPGNLRGVSTVVTRCIYFGFDRESEDTFILKGRRMAER